MLHRGKEHAAGEAAKKARAGSKENGGEDKKKRAKREMEYVHVPLLCEVMSTLMREMFEGGTPMRCLSSIVALGGTDFCRGTPRIGPHRMWELLPLVLRSPSSAPGKQRLDMFKRPSDEMKPILWEPLDEDVVCDVLMMRLYREVYSSHAPKRSRGFKELSDAIKSDSCRLGKVGWVSFTQSGSRP